MPGADAKGSRPYVSVIIATYNAATTLERCLSSLASQSFRDWELLVADGGSTDATHAILDAHRDVIAWQTSGPDRGIYDAWNKALAHASGTWVMFLGADDRLHDAGSLEQVVRALRASDRSRVVYGRLNVVDAAGRSLYQLGWDWGRTRASFKKMMSIPHPATFHHISLFRDRGRFDPSYRVAGDYEYLLRELPANDAQFTDVLVADMSNGGVSNQAKLRATAAIEVHRARRVHGLVRGPWWLRPGCVKAVARAAIGNRFGPRVEWAAWQSYRLLMRKSADTPEPDRDIRDLISK